MALSQHISSSSATLSLPSPKAGSSFLGALYETVQMKVQGKPALEPTFAGTGGSVAKEEVAPEDYRTFHSCLRALEPYAFSELFREHGGKGGGEDTRTRWWGDVPQKAVFQMRCGHCLHAIAAVVAVCVRPARSNILAVLRDCEQLTVIGGKMSFSSGVYPVTSCSCSSKSLLAHSPERNSN